MLVRIERRMYAIHRDVRGYAISHNTSNAIGAIDAAERGINQRVERHDCIMSGGTCFIHNLVRDLEAYAHPTNVGALRCHLETNGISTHGGLRRKDLLQPACELTNEHRGLNYAT